MQRHAITPEAITRTPTPAPSTTPATPRSALERALGTPYAPSLVLVLLALVIAPLVTIGADSAQGPGFVLLNRVLITLALTSAALALALPHALRERAWRHPLVIAHALLLAGGATGALMSLGGVTLEQLLIGPSGQANGLYHALTLFSAAVVVFLAARGSARARELVAITLSAAGGVQAALVLYQLFALPGSDWAATSVHGSLGHAAHVGLYLLPLALLAHYQATRAPRALAIAYASAGALMLNASLVTSPGTPYALIALSAITVMSIVAKRAPLALGAVAAIAIAAILPTAPQDINSDVHLTANPATRAALWAAAPDVLTADARVALLGYGPYALPLLQRDHHLATPLAPAYALHTGRDALGTTVQTSVIANDEPTQSGILWVNPGSGETSSSLAELAYLHNTTLDTLLSKGVLGVAGYALLLVSLVLAAARARAWGVAGLVMGLAVAQQGLYLTGSVEVVHGVALAWMWGVVAGGFGKTRHEPNHS